MPILKRNRESSRSTSSYTLEHAGNDLAILFQQIDKNNDGILSKQEFVDGLLAISFVDITQIEATRLFTTIDNDNSDTITLQEFVDAAKQIRWIRTLVKIFAASREYQFTIPATYNFTKSTTENYQIMNQTYIGDYADIRETRDYSYHKNYLPERQQWQDVAIRCCLGRTESQPRPWIIFTCGPMGVGKGHVLSWMSSQGLFPLEYIVHVDPDFFKRIMPEWDTYVKLDEETAGTLCHQESAYLQEIAQEVALRQRQHIWVDGSLSEGNWFLKVFDDIRSRYPHYRIAIIYINAEESTIRARIAKRSSETGRNIPEAAILRSLRSPEKSLQLLSPKTDLVVRIWNDNSIILQSVEDHSGNWHRALGKYFSTISEQPLTFPSSLGPLYLELTSFQGRMFQQSCSSTKEGILKLQLFSNEFESFWFSLTSGNTFSAYRINKLKKFECVYTWIIDENTRIEAINNDSSSPSSPSSPSSLAVSSNKKRDYESTFNSNSQSVDNMVALFQITFSPDSSVTLRESCRMVGSTNPIILCASDDATRDEWMASFHERVKKLTVRSSTCSSSSCSPSSNSTTTTTTSKGSSLERTRTTESVLSQQGYINLPPIESAQYECLDLSPLQCQSSPILLKLLWNLATTIKLTVSPLYNVLGKTEELELSGVPKGASHSRFVFPSTEFHTILLDLEAIDLNFSDPDILFLSWGGFIYYNQQGSVIGATALSDVDTQYFIQYSPPESLHSEDLIRLNQFHRWRPITRTELLNEGAKYFAFICPREELVTRRFPPGGSFAYIFHEPFEPSDSRDCYFTPITS